MDVTLFRDEQFSFNRYGPHYGYMKGYSGHSPDDEDDMFTEVCPMPKPPVQIFEWEEPEINNKLQLNVDIVNTIEKRESQVQDFAQTFELPVLNSTTTVSDNALTQIVKQESNLLQDILESPEAIFNFEQGLDSPLKIKSEKGPALKTDRSLSWSSDILNTSFGSTDLATFDITEYLFKDEGPQNKSTAEAVQIKTEEIHIKCEPDSDINPPPEPVAKRVVGAGRKKIDFKARRYIVDNETNNSSEDEVDIETVSEEDSAPVLEAGSITDLLEQFEATEACVKPEKPLKQETKTEKVVVKKTMIVESLKQEPKAQKRKQEQISNKSFKRAKGMQEQLVINNQKAVTKTSVKPQISDTASANNNKQIISSLPQELIDRIKESGKRRPITVIEAIPNVKKKSSKIQDTTTNVIPGSSRDTVKLDHSYCMSNKTVNSTSACVNSTNKQLSQKDSGFVSSEDDDKTVISMQPTVKNADGTLMVSLLKTNTIHKVDSVQINRKKLNLEEYKKRRSGTGTPKNNSQGCSPNTSTCSSPIPEEDEHQKMLRHQEKLRKMAQELLKTAPKSEQKKPEIELKVPKFAINTPQPEKHDPPKVPVNLERKVFVSFGTNTDFRIPKNQRDPLAPVEKLQEIKPLIDQVVKLNESSLISSVIDTIPKLIEKSERPNKIKSEPEPSGEHGEFKQVVYLEKNRVRNPTLDAETQTNVSLIEQSKRGRVRRRSSSSTSSSRCTRGSNPRSRKNSNSSTSSRSSVSSHSSRQSSVCSRSSDYSSRASSRLSYGRSRSRSPAYLRRSRNSNPDDEHLNAVEERRIIYVGRISKSTTKDDLRRKFRKFGPINKVSLHFREIGENYGFVTFKFKEDAHAAYEHGNDDPAFPYYKISFGGRRDFCKAAYSDLDNVRDVDYYQSQQSDDSYDRLLKDTLAKLKKRKA